MGMVAQRSLEVPVPGDIQTLAGKGPEQPNLTIKFVPGFRSGLDEIISRVPSNVHYSITLLHYNSVVQKPSQKF